MTGSISTRRQSFFGRKSILEYFIGKVGAFHDFFAYVGEYRIIIFPINKSNFDTVSYRIINSPFYGIRNIFLQLCGRRRWQNE
jgi:hypothetical protein